MKRLFEWLGLVLLVSAAQADSMSIIQLQNRPAEEVIPIVKPMLDPDDAISGQEFTIFLRSSPETLARVREIVDAIDTPAEVLQVSVFQGSERELSALGISGNVRIDGDNASIDIGNEPGNSDAGGGSITYSTARGSASISGIRTQESLRENPVHQVRVSAGTEAYIETGERIPYFYSGAFVGRRGFAGGVEYKDAVTGFYVLPRVRGDNVILEVSPFKSARSDTGRGNIDTQSATTTISGPIGEWLLIGGVIENVERVRSETGTSIATRGTGNSGIWIKADRAQ